MSASGAARYAAAVEPVTALTTLVFTSWIAPMKLAGEDTAADSPAAIWLAPVPADGAPPSNQQR